ncbi:DoxX family protein [hydrothermal vent metagenome]|uniref:DoxX family protein n=1 Tax=hydrothermal vent metagenome TaxID=652676 RepID=A0A1W1BYJ1_9ZZZZ
MDSQSIGKLLLRVMVGGLLLFHGVDKVLHGITYIENAIKIEELPYYIAYGVYIGEVLAPIMLVIGWKSRWWASVVVINMTAAIYLTQLKTFLSLGAYGAWSWEVPIFYLVGALAIVFLGGGKYSVSGD